jgi:hypothetical protein
VRGIRIDPEIERPYDTVDRTRRADDHAPVTEAGATRASDGTGTANRATHPTAGTGTAARWIRSECRRVGHQVG